MSADQCVLLRAGIPNRLALPLAIDDAVLAIASDVGGYASSCIAMKLTIIRPIGVEARSLPAQVCRTCTPCSSSRSSSDPPATSCRQARQVVGDQATTSDRPVVPSRQPARTVLHFNAPTCVPRHPVPFGYQAFRSQTVWMCRTLAFRRSCRSSRVYDWGCNRATVRGTVNWRLGKAILLARWLRGSWSQMARVTADELVIALPIEVVRLNLGNSREEVGQTSDSGWAKFAQVRTEKAK